MTSLLARRRGGLVYAVALCLLLTLCLLRAGPDVWHLQEYDEYGCGCPRLGPAVHQESLCGAFASSRGAGQRVVSYSLYGDLRDNNTYYKYFQAFRGRVGEVARMYPGWVARLYHNLSSHDPPSRQYLCDLYCAHPHLDLCHVDHLYPPAPNITEGGVGGVKGGIKGGLEKVLRADVGALSPENIVNPGILKSLKRAIGPDLKGTLGSRFVGRMWRFVVMGDPLVSWFVVRDVDSSVLPREAAAVRQWLHNSTAAVHAMRDHPSHNGVMLAGMWGGRRDRHGALLTRLLQEMLRWPPRNVWDYDQAMLRRVVWPEVLDNVLVHDSYFCSVPRFRSHHRSLPFPTQREGRLFVGWGPDRDYELPHIIPCPPECRPPSHQDWRLC